MSEGSATQDRVLLAALTVSAALVRLSYAMMPRMARWDEAGHLMVAHNLISGNGYAEMVGKPDVHLPPVLPFLSAGLLRLGLAPEWATAAVHIVMGALLCVPIYALGRAIYGRRAGFMAAALVAVYPALAAWPFVWSTMTESPFLLFVFSGVWAARKALTTDRARWYAAVGLAFGLAYLTRPEGLTYFAILGLYMVLWHIARRRLLQPVVIGKLALAAGACLALMSPYVIYLHSNTGHWTLSGKVGLILDIAPAYLAHDQAAHDLAVSRLDSTGQEIMWFSPERFNKSLGRYVAANPARFFFQVRQNMAETWLALFHQDLFSPWIVALAGLGIFARPWPKGRRWWDEALLWATLLPLASFWAFFVIDRFLIGALPVGLLWAAAGLDHLADWAPASLRAPWPRLGRTTAMTAAALPLALTLAFCLWVTPAQLKAGIDGMPWSNLAAARWLAAETPPDAVVMTRYTEVGLYSGRRLVPSPNAPLDEMLAYGRRHGARYLVVGEWELTTLRPQIGFLLDPAQAPPELEYLRTFGDDRKTLVYWLRD
jgi:4-amino-4-deoxy-L-arabinose transferase-like glycosyltransferase